MQIILNYGYKKDTLFVLKIDYILNSGFYELSCEFDNKLPLYREGKLQENTVISCNLMNDINLLQKNFENLIFQLKVHYKIHSYFFEEDIKNKHNDYRQELKFIYDLVYPMIKEMSKNHEELEILMEW